MAAPPDVAAARLAWPGAEVEAAPGDGYGVALVHGLRRARGEWVLVVDADLREPGPAVVRLWAARDQGEIVIGSRFAPGAAIRVPALRLGLSRALNRLFRRGLSLGVADLSSATRLVRRNTLAAHYDARGYDILQELLVRAYADGWRVVEVPIDYEPAHPGAAYPRAPRRRRRLPAPLLGAVEAAQLDPRRRLRRSRPRQRDLAAALLAAPALQAHHRAGRGRGPVLDVGCGSSRIIGALVQSSVCIDILRRKLRYARRFGRPLVHGSGFTLPVPDASFPCVLCSQVIEHVPKESPILERAGSRPRARRAPRARHAGLRALGVGGTEKLYGLAAPGGYADEHIGHYTARS